MRRYRHFQLSDLRCVVILFVMAMTCAEAGEFATLDQNSVVQNVIVANPGFLPLLGGNWFDANVGFYKAGRGYKWTGVEFQPPQPFPSWTFSVSAQIWYPPVPTPSPNVGGKYAWDEPSLTWIFTPTATGQSGGVSVTAP